MKIKLVLRPEEFTSFTSYYLEEFWRKYVDIEFYNNTRTYDRNNTVFVVWWQNADTEWPQQLKNDGYCVAVDNLWERSSNRIDYHWIENKKWFWYNECLWWQALGFDQYVPAKKVKYSALMLLGRLNPTRDYIIDTLGDIKNNMLWSCTELNRLMPDDIFHQDQINGHRYCNYDWYNETQSSLVVETMQYSPIFITEKSFKPIAYYHPYQIIGTPGVLKELKLFGFETYDNLFDETYDTVDSFEQRLAIIVDNLQRIELIKDYDSLTWAKLKHNRNRFFDTELVKQHMVTEIINPLIDYVHNRT
jgi:hypothetical protein